MNTIRVLILWCAGAVSFAQAPAAEPQSELPPPDEQPETPRARRLREAVEESRKKPASTTPIPNKPVPPKKTPWTFERLTSSGPLHYAFYYAPDYASVVAFGGLTLSLLVFPPPVTRRAAFGPSYDPDRGDTGEIMNPRYDRLLGSPFRDDTVPSWAPPVFGNAAVLAVGALTVARDRTFRKIHHFILGAMQAQLVSTTVAELMKSSFSRLRPDFRDRLARYSCAPERGPPPAGVDCTSVYKEARRTEAAGGDLDDVYIDRRELNNGRRSFPSGHTVSAFAIASYLTLFLGGELVWGETSNAVTRIPGIAAQIAALTAATFVAATRLSDGRHHPEDVVVGGGLGAAMAAGFYFLHFDLAGRPIVRNLSLAPFASAGGLGVNVRGLLP